MIKPAGPPRRGAKYLSWQLTCVAATVVAAAGAMLAAPAHASAAVNEVGSALAYEAGNSGAPAVTWGNDGQLNVGDLGAGVTMQGGTNLSVAGLAAAPGRSYFQVVWHGVNNDLWTTGAGPTDSGAAMMPGTSPSLAELSTGGLAEAFQGSNGDLWIFTHPGGANDTGIAMKPSTSPSITSEPVTATTPSGSFEVAFQSRAGVLSVYGSLDTRSLGYPMTGSPSIVGVFLPQSLVGSNAVVGYQIAADVGSDTGSVLNPANNVPPTVYSLWAAPGLSPFTDNTGQETNSAQPSVTSLTQ